MDEFSKNLKYKTMNYVGMIAKFPLGVHELKSFITPENHLFVLSHMGIPAIDIEQWKLKVSGLVEQNLELSYQNLLNLEYRELTVFHQCSGNPLEPKVPTRTISNVTWGGVSLREILNQLQVKSSARYVWFVGTDYGIYEGVSSDSYIKDIPIAKALDNDVLLAYKLNGEFLSAERGFPLRLVVPGYYGTNFVKWLSHIYVTDRRSPGTFTTTFYNEQVGGDDATLKPVWEVAPESAIVYPCQNEVLYLQAQTHWGWAWACNGIQSVDVSTDGGITWQAAEVEARLQYAWQRFTFQWTPLTPGKYSLMSRATDYDGVIQPIQGERNAIYTVAVTVKEATN
ncbi:molybdopterin-dependent oxidoreductase [Nostoc sp. KVJ3]|uniref:molybdopterin-dependent oxidoreductase n=1 Tax=Nostoc sp. KVJ3 TaxID=457945 RepID=UPI002238C21C|nr:molybdopterin-dependent oxidoreductase [Nostoc sp. KVJ3]MCW5314063.1 molybdopterin-dependent oxidoreductase [Nostoc sp. KVJ3]